MKNEEQVKQKLQNQMQTAQKKQQANIQINKQNEQAYVLKKPDEVPYPLNFGDAMFVLQDTRKVSDIVAQRDARNNELLADKENKDKTKPKLTFKERVTKKAESFKDDVSILNKNKRFILGDTPQMAALKRKVIALHNFLNSPDELNKMRKDGKSIDPAKFLETVKTVFNEAIEACEWYLQNKTPSSWWGKGKERYRMVSKIKTQAEADLQSYTMAHTALVQNAVVLSSGQMNTPLAVLQNILTTEVIGQPEWQNQGNSTDVYKIKLRINGEEKTFYMKENLQLISANIPAFLDRRKKQLSVSQQNKKANKPDKEEQRMVENKTDDVDYQNGINLLEKMKEKLDNEGNMNERHKMEQRFANFFGHDFDEMFKEYHAYVSALENNEQVSVADLLEEWQDKLDADQNNYMAQQIVKALKDAVNSENGEKPKPITAFEWMKDRICKEESGLDPDKDKDIIKLLGEMQEKNANERKKDTGAGRIETLFRVTLGKEVELYGQMKQRGNIADNEIAAANNSATAELAKQAGFTEVICDSYSTLATYKDRTGQDVQNFVTVIEVAEGEEMVELLHSAIRNKKKIKYTPNAIRQLIKLHAMDLVCLQVDRHGRNFKCDVINDNEGNYVVTSIKAYDNDMSFTEESLLNVFLSKDKKDTKKAGFLPPIFKTVKKNSLEYVHLAKNYFHMKAKRGLNPPPKGSKPQFTNRKGQLQDMNDKAADILMIMPFKQPEDFMAKKGEVKKRAVLNRKGEVVEEAKELSYESQEGRKAIDEFNSLIKGLMDILYVSKTKDDDKKYFMEFNIKEKLSDDEKQTLGQLIKRLEALHENYDFTDNVEFNGYMARTFINVLTNNMFNNCVGAKEGWITAMLHYLTNRYCKDDFVQKGYQEMALEEPKEMQALHRKDQEPGEEGDLYVPTLLHYDNEAYKNLCELDRKLNEGDPDLIGKLNDRHITDEAGQGRISKLQALKNRVRETIDQLKAAEKAAQNFYKAMGYDEKDKRAKFFLDREDYKEFSDLKEFTWNAGETYLAIDNDQFLAGQEEFSTLMTPGEKQQWLDATNTRLTDQKRHKFRKIDDVTNNPLSGEIYRGAA